MATVPAPGTLCTGDSASVNLVRYSFLAPSDLWVGQTINGMLYDMTDPNHWTQCGLITVDQAAQIFGDLLDSLTLSTDQIGTIVLWAGPIPAGGVFLACDGTNYLISDYPALFAAIGNAYGGDGVANFNVPDLRGAAPIGAGQRPGGSNFALASFVGEETHTLIEGEMPSHVHTEGTATPTLINGGLEAPATSAVPSAGLTGAAGGGGAHNNLQPSLVVNYAILSR